MSEKKIIIVGAGLSGLACATELAKHGISCQIFEASDDVGGRVRTDVVDGFLLDRGFQVFLTAYPEAKRFLDYQKLKLQSFKAGAVIRYEGNFCRISDVIRHPGDLPGNVFSRAGSLADKLKIASLRSQVSGQSIAEIEAAENITTRQRLEDFGFSARIIDSFFRPFFGGVFLEGNLTTSRRMFDFVFKMFSSGNAALPAGGMGQIAKQMAAALPAETIALNSPVKSVSENGVVLASGESIVGDAVVVATDQQSADSLLQQQPDDSVGVTCLYFAAESSPVGEPILVLNGDSADGPINNLCVPSDVAPAYAPDGQSLISITVLGANDDEKQLRQRVIEHAASWYGDQVGGWRHLRTYQIAGALPQQGCENLEAVRKPYAAGQSVYRIGDYTNFASIQGALVSGRELAEHLSGEGE